MVLPLESLLYFVQRQDYMWYYYLYVLFEGELRLFKICIVNPRATTEKVKERCLIDTSRADKWNHTKCSIKTRKRKKCGGEMQ
jgi:hypothetical protein